MDSKLKGISIESKKTQNRAQTRKLRSSEVEGLAQTVQLGSYVKPMKLCSRGSFKAPVQAIFSYPNSSQKLPFHPETNPPQLSPQFGHKHDTKLVPNSTQNQLQSYPKKKLDIIAQNQKKISFCVREHNQDQNNI